MNNKVDNVTSPSEFNDFTSGSKINVTHSLLFFLFVCKIAQFVQLSLFVYKRSQFVQLESLGCGLIEGGLVRIWRLNNLWTGDSPFPSG